MDANTVLKRHLWEGSRFGIATAFACLFSASTNAMPVDFPNADQSDSLAVAYDCLAALALYANGSDTMLGRAMIDGDKLSLLARTDSRGRLGWPYIQRATKEAEKCGMPGSLDAFNDGSCNPPETAYMLQTGYAVTCLAQLSIALSNKDYLGLAIHAMEDSWDIGTVADSDSSFYYWYSYHTNDYGRYVRNTNSVMGLAAAWMYSATGSLRYRDRAIAIARAEHREIRDGNLGYFGTIDPRFRAQPVIESSRIENHIPHQVKALKDIGTLLQNQKAIKDAKILLDAFINCNNARCRPNNCASWAAPPSCKASATIAPCILADRGTANQSRCESVLQEISQLNAFQIFMAYSTSDAKALQRKQ